MIITQPDVKANILKSNTDILCIQSSSGISYIEVSNSNGLEVSGLPSPIQFEIYRGDNNDPIK